MVVPDADHGGGLPTFGVVDGSVQGVLTGDPRHLWPLDSLPDGAQRSGSGSVRAQVKWVAGVGDVRSDNDGWVLGAGVVWSVGEHQDGG